MNKVTLGIGIGLGVALCTAGCQFSMGTRDPKTARNTKPAASATPAASTPTAPAAKPTPRVVLRPIPRRTAPPVALADGGATIPTTPPVVPPAGAVAITGPTDFGVGTADATTQWQGTVFFVNAETTAFPDVNTAKASATLYTKELNIAPKAFTAGFPGVDAARTKWFAIRYQGPLVVTTEADYTLRLVADDGAQLRIDATQASASTPPIVDNNGVKQKEASVTGPVHLVVGTHLLVIDYFQAAGSQVALQLYCTKAGDKEQICPTKLP